MTSSELAILTNIIGAVESGGQIYGNRRYDAYAGAYANSNIEHTCTLGWAQNYGSEARTLCKNILAKDPVAFRKADTANIEKKLSVDWVATRWNPNAREKKALIAIITTEAGKKCQDELFESLMKTYIKQALEFDPKMSVQAQMMWCEIEHLGGLSPVKRIFGRASKPYTPDSIYASLILDQKDTSSSNQVGDSKFQTRHRCCVKWIKQYVKTANNKTPAPQTGGNKMTENQLRQSVVDFLVKYKGIAEGSAKHKEILAYFNNSGFCTRYKMTVNDAWCATAVSATFIALGLAGKSGSGKLFECCECSCYYMIKLAKKQGIWVENDSYVPKTGDVVLYDWDDSGYGDNQGNPDHVGIVMSVSGNTIKVIEGNKNNTVATRDLSVNGRYIRGFITPKYSKFSTGGSTTPVTPTPSSAPSTPSKTTGIKATSTSKFKISGSTTPNKTKKYVGKCTASSLNVRTWAGTENPKIKSYPELRRGNLVSVCDAILSTAKETWYYIKIANKYYGFVHSDYIEFQ